MGADLAVRVPFCLFAEIRAVRDGSVLYIRRSVLVKDDDVRMTVVNSFLEEACHVPGTSVVVEDKLMMFGKAEVTIHQVFPVCPGHGMEHVCRAAG